jgi:cysteine-rich repeat protein|tara:strand:+ start:863 stop:1405 length:543 start_codon:yes stop_codon:yes gene_type:complete
VVCGDEIRGTGEACDNGDVYDGEGCSSISNGNLGGIRGADAICNTLASNANLEGTFVSWLSTGDQFTSSHAKDRIPSDFSGLKFYRTEGIRVAENLAVLLSGNIEDKINRDENGDTQGGEKHVFTGTDPGGLHLVMIVIVGHQVQVVVISNLEIEIKQISNGQITKLIIVTNKEDYIASR